MKQNLWICTIFAAISMTFLAGCTTSGQEEVPNDGSAIGENVIISTISLPTETEEITLAETITVKTKTSTVGDVTVEYPVITGLEEEETETAIRGLLRDDRKAFMDRNLRDSEGEPLSLTGSIHATLVPHNDSFSVVTAGTVSDNSGNKTFLVYTTTVSLVDGSRVSTGVRTHAEAAAKAIAAGKGQVLSADGSEGSDLLSSLSEEELTELLTHCDTVDGEEAAQCWSYYLNNTADEIGIYLPTDNGWALVILDDALLG